MYLQVRDRAEVAKARPSLSNEDLESCVAYWAGNRSVSGTSAPHRARLDDLPNLNQWPTAMAWQVRDQLRVRADHPELSLIGNSEWYRTIMAVAESFCFATSTEVVHDAYEAFTEKLLLHGIRNNAGGELIVRRGEPLSGFKASAVFRVHLGLSGKRSELEKATWNGVPTLNWNPARRRASPGPSIVRLTPRKECDAKIGLLLLSEEEVKPYADQRAAGKR